MLPSPNIAAISACRSVLPNGLCRFGALLLICLSEQAHEYSFRRFDNSRIVEAPSESVLELLNGRTLERLERRAALELLEPMEPYVSDNA